MYPHTPYLPSKNHLNQQTFSFDFVSKIEKHQKSRKISPLFLLTPVHFHFSEVKRSILEKVIFRRIGRLEIFRSEKVNHRNLREISAKFHRDFIEISLVASQKKKKKGKLFYLSKAIFFEKLASTLTASISAPLQDRNFKFCMFT